mgnify:FL=1
MRRQTVTNSTTALPLHHIKLQLPTGVTVPGVDDVFPVTAIQMAVRIDEFRARVLLDIVFGVDNNLPSWVSEAVVKIGLPSTASPFYLAFGKDIFLPPNKTTAVSRQQTLFNAVGPFVQMAFSTFKQVVTQPLVTPPAAAPPNTLLNSTASKTTTTTVTITTTTTTTAPPNPTALTGVDDDPTEWELSDLAARKMRSGRWVSAVREAVMVKKAVASRAYTDTVRRGVDPALLEQSDTGTYSLRVFPLFRGTQHRLSLGYDVDLRDGCDTPLGSACGTGSENVTYRYPLAMPSPRGNVLVDVSMSRTAAQSAVIRSGSQPQLASLIRGTAVANVLATGGVTADASQSVKEGRIYVTVAPTDFNRDNASDATPAVVELNFFPSAAPSRQAYSLVSYRPSLGGSQRAALINGSHFAVDVSLDNQLLSPDDAVYFTTTPTASNRTVLFVLDTSLSSGYPSVVTGYSQYELTLVALERLLNSSRPAVGVAASSSSFIAYFNIALFDVSVEWWKGPPGRWLPNTPSQVTEAVAFLRSVSLDGATDLATALDYATRMSSEFTSVETSAVQGAAAAMSDLESIYTADAWDIVLACDGGATWGDVDLRPTIALMQQRRRTVFGLSHYLVSTSGVSVVGANENLLRDVVISTGGDFLGSLPTDDGRSAFAQMLYRPIRVLDVRVTSDKGEPAEDVVLDRTSDGGFSFMDRRILVAGRFASPSALPTRIELQLLAARTGAIAVLTITVTQRMYSPLATRLYGTIATRRLEYAFPMTATLSLAYAVAYRVVGKSASLLMLESAADYARYGIDPDKDPIAAAQTVLKSPVSATLADLSKSLLATLTDPRQRIVDDLNYVLAYSGGVPISLPWHVWALVNGTKAPAAFSFASAINSVSSVAFLRSARGIDLMRNDSLLLVYMRNLLTTFQLPYAAWDNRRNAMLEVYKLPGDAMRAFSSLLEQETADVPLARDVALTVRDIGFTREAMSMFARLLRLRPYEPQSIAALAVTAGAAGLDVVSVAWFEVIMAASWPPQFGEFAKIIAFSYSRQLTIIGSDAVRHASFIDLNAAAVVTPLNTPAAFWTTFIRDRRSSLAVLSGTTVADIVIIVEWSTDHPYVDPHVIEPSGEECFWARPRTKLGGTLTADVTRGFGPIMYRIVNASDGDYAVNVQYYGVSSRSLAPQIKTYITTVTNWGYSTEFVNRTTVLLSKDERRKDLGVVRKVSDPKRTAIKVVDADFGGLGGKSSVEGSDSSSPPANTAASQSSQLKGAAGPIAARMVLAAVCTMTFILW